MLSIAQFVSHANNAESDILKTGGSGGAYNDSNKRKLTAIAFITTTAAT